MHDESKVSDISKVSSDQTVEDASSVEDEPGLILVEGQKLFSDIFPEDSTLEQHEPSTAASPSLPSSISHPFPALNDDGSVWTPPSEEDILHYLREHAHRAQNFTTHNS